MKDKNKIPVNIWDDYWEDGYVPEGEFQETFAYVEDYDISLEEKGKILLYLMNFIDEKIELQGTEMNIFIEDDRKKYSKLIGTEDEFMLKKRYKLQFKKITHKQREILVTFLQKQNLMFENKEIVIYSES